MRHSESVAETIMHAAADFLARESNHESLITVTNIDLSPDFRNATLFLSVLPRSQETKVLAFAKRIRSDVREYLKERSALHPIPTVDFEIDYGEQNRQRVDELMQK